MQLFCISLARRSNTAAYEQFLSRLNDNLFSTINAFRLLTKSSKLFDEEQMHMHEKISRAKESTQVQSCGVFKRKMFHQTCKDLLFTSSQTDLCVSDMFLC